MKKNGVKSKRKFKIITRTDIIGFSFVMPFIIGFIWLFFKPLCSAVQYSFNRVTMDENGIILEAMQWENYRYMLFGDASFIKGMVDVLSGMFVKVLVIMFMSMFLAILLNADFPGRLLFRALLFLPVIFNTEQVMSNFETMSGQADLTETANSFVIMSGELTGFVKEIIESFGVLAPVISEFTGYAGSMFNLLWDSGIQIILFIIGLQSIPGHLYEVAEIEGATKWETFWKITFPLLTPSILLCLIFTTIQYFNASNTIVKLISTNMLVNLGYACSLSIFYAIIVLILIMLIYKIVSQKTIYLD